MVLIPLALYTLYKQQQQQQGDNPLTSDETTLRDIQTAVQGGASQLAAALQCTNNNNNDKDDDFHEMATEESPQSLSLVTTTATSTTTPTVVAAVAEEDDDEPDAFDETVRQEWWNAVYGVDFMPLREDYPFPDDDRPCSFAPTGVGLAGIPSYTALAATIPIPSTTGGSSRPDGSGNNNKVGVTISRLSLGLYVRAVEPGSEAYLAGIPCKSVLVSINGLPLLAEASKPALERLWHYQGHYCCSTNNDNERTAVSDYSTAAEPATVTTGVVKEPVALQFIRNGKLFTVLLVSNPPWGIAWAPCGNFPLVKRVYAYAAAAGVPRGSLVAAVNHWSGRDLDHTETAMEIRRLFQEERRRPIRLVLVFPPAAARAAAGAADMQLPKEPRRAPLLTKKTVDGVEIKFHPWDVTAARAMCNSGGMVRPDTELQIAAEQVAAGRVLPVPKAVPGRALAAALSFGPCPSLDNNAILDSWDPIDSLNFCIGMHQANFDHAVYTPIASDATEATRIARLQEITSCPDGPSAAFSFVLQFLSIVCSPEHYTKSEDENKTDEAYPTRAAGSELTSILLKLSRQDEGFCQYLYFLLRSFISTFETRRPSIGGDRNLVALLHCLELLRFAEKELASRPLTGKPSAVRSLACPPSPERTMRPTVTSSSPTSRPPSPVAASPGSPDSEEESAPEIAKRGVLGFFRKKKQPSKLPMGKTASVVLNQAPIQNARPVVKRTKSLDSSETNQLSKSLSQSPSAMYENMSDFLSELDRICSTMERSLQKSFRQKVAEWALQPWSASKDNALAQVTEKMRESLRQANESSDRMLLVNPVESSELLSSIDYDECYILPSAHFPILLTFNVSERRGSNAVVGEHMIYQTTVEVVSLLGHEADNHSSYVVHSAVAGEVAESGPTQSSDPLEHIWRADNIFKFETRSSWGAPQTLSLRLSANTEVIDHRVSIQSPVEIGFCWVDLSKHWLGCDTAGSDSSRTATVATDVWPLDAEGSVFDEKGLVPGRAVSGLKLELRISTKRIEFSSSDKGCPSRKRMLLYKHDDDLRQEAFAVQFIRTCDNILKASGLDMMLLTFHCVPVGTRRGFVEWVPGSVPLSEICQPFAGSLLAENRRNSSDDDSVPPMFAKASLTKYESLRRLQQSESLRRLGGGSKPAVHGSMANNPVQDYLRSVAYDHDAAYMIRKEVMDTYVKSSAGYCVITYILGVGDRHLDNLLLHQSGSFFHCDFSFILGQDPKKYLPMRITEDMVGGMGGRDSDNFAKFLSLAGAAFLALRHPENVRMLLSMVRMMEAALLPDVSENQPIQEAIYGLRNRLRLDLSEDQALTFMEELVESSLSSKIWLAVDAIHNLGKKIKL
jgi:hypothetical protein